MTPVGLETSAAVLEGRVRAAKLFRNNHPSLPLGPDKQSERSHCRGRSTRVSDMARPAGRLASLLQSQSAGAKAAIEAHLAPAVAKGSVNSHVLISLLCSAETDSCLLHVTSFARNMTLDVQNLIADHASGSWVWTVGGKKVLDFGCGEAIL